MSRRHANSDVFAAIADPTRRAILRQLGDGEQPVTALAASFASTLSAVSQHIRVLHDAGLVTVRKAGRERLYRLNPEPLKTVADWLSFYEPFWNRRLEALAAYLDESGDDIPTDRGERIGHHEKEEER
jgi:DNA-binding transcriptional ArsR family regulator